MDQILDFRKEHHRGVPKYYSATANYLITVLLISPAIYFGGLALFPLTFKKIFLIILYTGFASVVEYALHRWLLHIEQPAFRKPFVEHTLKHHRFFDHQHLEITESKDVFRVLFPAWGVFLIIYLFLFPVSFILGNQMKLVGGVYFLLYETVHLICHLRWDHPIFRFEIFRKWRAYHRMHHDPRYMDRFHFNIVLPFGDWLFKTKMPRTQEGRPQGDWRE